MHCSISNLLREHPAVCQDGLRGGYSSARISDNCVSFNSHNTARQLSPSFRPVPAIRPRTSRMCRESTSGTDKTEKWNRMMKYTKSIPPPMPSARVVAAAPGENPSTRRRPCANTSLAGPHWWLKVFPRDTFCSEGIHSDPPPQPLQHLYSARGQQSASRPATSGKTNYTPLLTVQVAAQVTHERRLFAAILPRCPRHHSGLSAGRVVKPRYCRVRSPSPGAQKMPGLVEETHRRLQRSENCSREVTDLWVWSLALLSRTADVEVNFAQPQAAA